MHYCHIIVTYRLHYKIVEDGCIYYGVSQKSEQGKKGLIVIPTRNAHRHVSLSLSLSLSLRARTISKYLNPPRLFVFWSRCPGDFLLTNLSAGSPGVRINQRYYSSIWIKLLLSRRGGYGLRLPTGSAATNRRMANHVSQIDLRAFCFRGDLAKISSKFRLTFPRVWPELVQAGQEKSVRG